MTSNRRHISNHIVKAIVNKLEDVISSSQIVPECKAFYQEKLARLCKNDNLQEILNLAENRITPTDMKYLLCFYMNMEVQHISQMFNIEISSVYTVRYRLRKKLKDENGSDLILL